jgi:hypothetical protein
LQWYAQPFQALGDGVLVHPEPGGGFAHFGATLVQRHDLDDLIRCQALLFLARGSDEGRLILLMRFAEQAFGLLGQRFNAGPIPQALV